MSFSPPRANTVILIGQIKGIVVSNQSIALTVETAESVVNSVLVVSAPADWIANPPPVGTTIQVTGLLLAAGAKQQVAVGRDRGHDVRILAAADLKTTPPTADDVVAKPAAHNVAAEPTLASSPQSPPTPAPAGLGILGRRRPAGMPSTTPAETSPQSQPPRVNGPAPAAPAPRPSGSGLGKLAARSQVARVDNDDEPRDFPGDSEVPISAYEQDHRQYSTRQESAPTSYGRRNEPDFGPNARDLDVPF